MVSSALDHNKHRFLFLAFQMGFVEPKSLLGGI